MKPLLLFFFTTISILGISQEIDTMYFDKTDKQIESADYFYKRVISRTDDNHYLVKDFYNNNHLKQEIKYLVKGKYIASETDFLVVKPFEEKSKFKTNGKYISYYPSGAKKMEIDFVKGKVSVTNKRFMENGEEIYLILNPMPEYPGGTEQLRKDIQKEVKYPEEANGILGTVYISFVIDKNGFVKNAEVARSVHPLLDMEALRVINSLRQWKAGQFKGNAANMQFTIPINFN